MSLACSTLIIIGNPVAELRLAEHDLDIEAELVRQSKHDEQSSKMKISYTGLKNVIRFKSNNSLI